LLAPRSDRWLNAPMSPRDENAPPPGPWPEIAEAAAEGTVAAVYDGLRRALGVPMVNFIFRHMATRPGLLEWCWSILGPAYGSGAIAAGAAGLRRAARDALAGAAHDAPALPEPVARLLGDYNRANPMNLIGMRIIARALDTAPPGGGGPPVAAHPMAGAAPGGQPVALAPAAMDAASAARVRRLALLATGGTGWITPTLYRQLANWPEDLAGIERLIAPIVADGSLARCAASMVAAADRLAAPILAGLEWSDRPPGSLATLRRLIAAFPPVMAHMTVVGLYLEGAPRPVDRGGRLR
jgi:hypothetical protein